MNAARTHFATQGYAATSLREVATAAGVTKPMVYYYFGSKEGLYRTLLENVHERFRAILRTTEQAPATAKERLVALIRGHAQLALQSRVDMQLWLAATLGPPGGIPKVEVNRELQTQGQEQLEDIIAAGIASGELAPVDPQAAALAVRGAITVFYAMALETNPAPTPDPRLPEQLVELLLHGLSPGSAHNPGPGRSSS